MRTATFAAIALGCIAITVLPAGANIIGTFDSAGNYSSFDSLTAAYRTFMGTPSVRIDFSDMALGANAVGDHYAATKGVTFSNEGLAIILPEGSQVVAGWYQGNLAGYGNGGMPGRGAAVYNSIYDTDANAPLTISFAAEVASVGGYIANSAGAASSLTIKAYNKAGDLLSSQSTSVNPWGDCDNIEGFWGVTSDHADISSITILSSGNYGVTSLGWVDWNPTATGGSIATPEPCAMALIAIGGIVVLVRRRRLA